MADALERFVNLALFLADSHVPVSAEQVRAEVEGYPADQDEAAFLRMFERDKDDLRAAGLVISVVEAEGAEGYLLDRSATYATEVPLSGHEVAALRAVGAALADDPAFPYADDLRLALAKVMPRLDPGRDTDAVGRVADEAPEAQGAAVAVLASAVETRKAVRFGYTNALGEPHDHAVEPYGLYLRDGRWYLVGRDTALGEARVYACARMRAPEANAKQPKSPDFERPAGFDVRAFFGLPFQYGPGEPFEAVVVFSAEHAWRAPRLTAGAGTVAERPDGSLEWRVTARDARRLARWVVESGPGIALAAPAEAVAVLRDGLAEAASAHD